MFFPESKIYPAFPPVVDPCIIRNGAYVAPESPGFSIEMKARSISDNTFLPAIEEAGK